MGKASFLMATEAYYREMTGWRSFRTNQLVTQSEYHSVTHGSQINSSNTGWRHTGVQLTTIGNNQSGLNWHTENSVFYITGDDVTIDSFDIPFPVRARGDRITIKRSKISSASYYLVQAADIPTYYTDLMLIDCELYGMDLGTPPTIAVMACENATYMRCDIHGFGSSGPRLTTNNLIEECYIHDFAHEEPEHEAGVSANGPDTNVNIVRSRIEINSGGASCAIGIYLDFGSHNGILLEDNFIQGGAYTLQSGIYVPGAGYPAAQNVVVRGNIFGRSYHAESGIYGPVSQWRDDPDCVWENNTWGPGAAADSNHNTGDPVIA
ncbi:MAG: hypothetical protein ACOH18_02670 [Candidatus Saccharimonadaceae bacterium]